MFNRCPVLFIFLSFRICKYIKKFPALHPIFSKIRNKNRIILCLQIFANQFYIRLLFSIAKSIPICDAVSKRHIADFLCSQELKDWLAANYVERTTFARRAAEVKKEQEERHA